MKMTLTQRSAAAAGLPVSAGAWGLCVPTAARVQGAAASAAVRVRHTDSALGTDVVLGTAADAAPPPRGAPV